MVAPNHAWEGFPIGGRKGNVAVFGFGAKGMHIIHIALVLYPLGEWAGVVNVGRVPANVWELLPMAVEGAHLAREKAQALGYSKFVALFKKHL